MFMSQSYLLKNSSEMRHMFLRHFVNKCCVDMLYTFALATIIQLMYLIMSAIIPLLRDFDRNLKIIIALGPIISMVVTLTGASVLRYPIAAGLFLTINPQFRVRVSLLEFLTVKHMKQVALALGVLIVCCPG